MAINKVVSFVFECSLVGFLSSCFPFDSCWPMVRGCDILRTSGLHVPALSLCLCLPFFEFSGSSSLTFLDVKTHTFFSFSLLNKEVYLVLLAHSLTRSLIHSLTVGTPYKNVSYFRVHVRFHYLGRCRRRKLPATTSDWLSLCIYIIIQTESVKRRKDCSLDKEPTGCISPARSQNHNFANSPTE